MSNKLIYTIDTAQIIENKIIIIGWLIDQDTSISDYKLKIDNEIFDLQNSDYLSIVREDVNTSYERPKEEKNGFILIKSIDTLSKKSDISLISERKTAFKKSNNTVVIQTDTFTYSHFEEIVNAYKLKNIAKINNFLKKIVSTEKPSEIFCALDSCIAINEKSLLISGWAYATSGETVDINTVEDSTAHIYTFQRDDLKSQEDIKDNYKHAGFFGVIELENPSIDTYIELSFNDAQENIKVITGNISSEEDPKALSQQMLQYIEIKPGFKEKFEEVYGSKLNDLWTEYYDDLHIEPEVTIYGDIPEQPKLSIIVPLYGRIDFMEYQTSMFAVDPLFRSEIELIYVLDDPDRFYDVIDEVSKGLYKLSNVPFKVVKYTENLGYARANNVGVQFATSDMILLLNSDVFPQEKGWTKRLLDIYKTLDVPGVLGCKLLFEDNSIQHAGMRFLRNEGLDNMWTNVHPYKGMPDIDKSFSVKEVPAVTGACMLLEKKHYEDVGGLTESYVLGDFEDSDLCLKLMEKELKIYYSTEPVLYHLERQSQSLFDDQAWKFKITVFNCWQQTSKWDTKIENLMERFDD